jgi:hypothetical protein
MAKPRKIVLGPPATREKDDSEVRWLMSYSDFMMQLVCLFILLYSSSLDKGRMSRVAAGYRASLGMGELAAHETKSAGDSWPSATGPCWEAIWAAAIFRRTCAIGSKRCPVASAPRSTRPSSRRGPRP